MRETDYVSAACALVPRALFLRHGMFDLHFSPGYYEDTDLAFTVRHTPPYCGCTHCGCYEYTDVAFTCGRHGHGLC